MRVSTHFSARGYRVNMARHLWFAVAALFLMLQTVVSQQNICQASDGRDGHAGAPGRNGRPGPKGDMGAPGKEQQCPWILLQQGVGLEHL